MKQNVEIKIDSKSIDEAIKKANRLIVLLQEIRQIISSLLDKELET